MARERTQFKQTTYISVNAQGELYSTSKEPREGFELVELEDEKFTMFMRYLRWAFVSLSNGKLAVEENRFTFLNGTTGVDPVNAFAFTHNKEDSEITTFICIFTIMDIQKDAAGTSAAGKINLDKIQSVHNISDALLGRLKKFYA